MIRENDIIVLNMSSYVKPEIIEMASKDYVLNGENNEFFTRIREAYQGSPTLKSIIDTYIRMIFGKGLKASDSVKNLIDKAELRKIITDFKVYGSAIGQVVYTGSGSSRKATGIFHFNREAVASGKMNEDGEINNYFYSKDWKNLLKNKPISYPRVGTSKEKIEFFEISQSHTGRLYYADPDFISAISYAILEDEIQNYAVKHAQRGLSAGYFININSGKPATEEEARRAEALIRRRMTGSDQGGSIIVQFNNNKDEETTISPMPVNERQHLQWTFWAEEARRQLMVSTSVTSPMLFGIREATGFGNNKDEMIVATKLLHEMKIKPEQEIILDGLMAVLKTIGISEEIEFDQLDMFADVSPTEDVKVNVQQPVSDVLQASMRADSFKNALSNAADWLIEQGEESDDDEIWELADERAVHGDENLFEIKMAKTFSSFPSVKSEQDNELFKIRYKYMPGSDVVTPQREFCRKLIAANKTYRKEDIILAGDKVVNEGFGPDGADTYNIWLYKGGVNCKHFWQRRVFLRRNNKNISVAEAREIINNLDPSQRAKVRLPRNEKEVAQIAEDGNNHWKLR